MSGETGDSVTGRSDRLYWSPAWARALVLWLAPTASAGTVAVFVRPVWVPFVVVYGIWLYCVLFGFSRWEDRAYRERAALEKQLAEVRMERQEDHRRGY